MKRPVYIHPIISVRHSERGRVAEMGVRSVVSTWALLCGLAEGGQRNPVLFSVDIVPCPIEQAQAAARAAGIALQFLQTDSATVVFPGGPVDLLFIDTWHVYAHLKRELLHHAANVRQWIILHDTEIDRDFGETIRMGELMNAEEQSKQSGYALADIRRGLRPAVLEFLLADPEWDVVHHYRHCNGLTVLGRRGVHALPEVAPGPSHRPSCQTHYVPDFLWIGALLSAAFRSGSAR